MRQRVSRRQHFTSVGPMRADDFAGTPYQLEEAGSRYQRGLVRGRRFGPETSSLERRTAPWKRGPVDVAQAGRGAETVARLR